MERVRAAVRAEMGMQFCNSKTKGVNVSHSKVNKGWKKLCYSKGPWTLLCPIQLDIVNLKPDHIYNTSESKFRYIGNNT